MVTAKTTELDKVKGLDLGADDYLSKPFGVMELISRVKALLRRSASIQKKEEYEFEDIILNDSKLKCIRLQGKCDLTYKEYELLKYLIMNEGIVLTRDRLMRKSGAWILLENPVRWICILRHCVRNLVRPEN